MSADARGVKHAELMRLGRELLIALGENPDREGLKETPARWARFWLDFIHYDAGRCDTAFEHASVDQMVIVSGVRIWSMCEHHLIPFWCRIAIGYLPKGRVLGLSKFARIAHARAHRPQLQERLVQEIAADIARLAQTEDVAVLGQGEHLCMTMRGIKTEGIMTSSVMGGVFRADAQARAEFLSLVSKAGPT